SQNCFTAALRSAASITDHSTRLNTLISLGACLAHAKDKRARTVLVDALSIVPRKGYGPDLAKYLRLLAAALVAAGDSRANAVIKKGMRVALNAERDGSA